MLSLIFDESCQRLVGCSSHMTRVHYKSAAAIDNDYDIRNIIKEIWTYALALKKLVFGPFKNYYKK